MKYKTAEIYLNEVKLFTITFEKYYTENGTHVFFKRETEDSGMNVTAIFPLNHSVIVL